MQFARGTPFDEDVLRKIRAILEREHLLDHVPHANEVIASIGAAITEGTRVADVHDVWQPHVVGRLQSLPPFPMHPVEAKSPPQIRHVFIECIERPSGGMSSYYGFEGFFVSLLIDLLHGFIWDARG
ncbi:MAG TPA: hypothetical protein VN605_09085, partial [Thermoanaerobaculia bacterium]|nr:hypothetical protein [Thermoanaerobaculia bacterium]